MSTPSLPLRPVIVALPEARRPGPTACATCPAAMWHALPNRVRCYCRRMHVETFSSDQPEERILLCDGLVDSSAALEVDMGWDVDDPTVG